MKEVTVLIVDDHPLFREGIRNVLDSEKDIEVVAETTNGDEGLELVRDLLPMVALIDVNLPSMNGIQLTRQIVAERTRDKIQACRRRGRWTGGRPPLGYDVARDGGKLLVNPTEADQVVATFAMYAENLRWLASSRS